MKNGYMVVLIILFLFGCNDNAEVSVENISELSNVDLVYEIDRIVSDHESYDDTNSENLKPHFEELTNRKKEFSQQEIIEIISEDSYSLFVQDYFVGFYIRKHEQTPDHDFTILNKLLKEENIDLQIKQKILEMSRFGESDMDVLKDLIQNNSNLSSQSLVQLSRINDKMAYDISEEILTNKEQFSESEISAALRVTSVYLSENQSDEKNYLEQEKGFLSTSFSIIEDDTGQSLTEAAFFAVSDLMSKTSIRMIIESESINNSLKVFAVDQNYIVLKEIISENPTESDIQLVVEAMEILPLVDLLDDLKEIKSKIQDQDLIEKIGKVIQNIELEGVEANKKWLER
ncbi:hypothetical protein LGQ02_11365 [Bacillus shivajii]|uniref:hypothetical protein n=1 Tax=Bacillus shivajii TaxID=1983719 RepID=UPI001CFA1725|nr:hypothetical protein [Bacillus shivajii]UCZ51476.1 hypothetical protein LGQ02_11365 [Bacillus shivajii]